MSMKKPIAAVVLSTILACLCVHGVQAETQRLSQWIAPLECTRNQIVNGVSIVTIITPQECNDVLNPPTTDPGTEHGGSHSPVVAAPNAPDTGVFHDTATTGTMIVILSVFLGCILYLLLRNTGVGVLSNRSGFSILSRRVSSFPFVGRVYTRTKGKRTSR